MDTPVGSRFPAQARPRACVMAVAPACGPRRDVASVLAETAVNQDRADRDLGLTIGLPAGAFS